MNTFGSMSSPPTIPDLTAILSNVYVRGAGLRVVERAHRTLPTERSAKQVRNGRTAFGRAPFEIGKQIYSELKVISRQFEDVIDHILQRGVGDQAALRLTPMLQDLHDGTPEIVAVAERQIARGNTLMEGMPELIRVLDRKVGRAIAKLEAQINAFVEADFAKMADTTYQPSKAALTAAEEALARMSSANPQTAEAWADRLASQVAALTD